jgi:hypothetical protein
MVPVAFWVKLLLLIFMMRQSDEFQKEASCVEVETLQECIEENLVS